MQGASGHEDTLVPSLRNVTSQKGDTPDTLATDWVAPNATVIGNVSIKEGSSVWHGAILRGDLNKITIGRNSMIQDNARLNGSTIGDNVYVGPNAKI